MKLNSGAVGKDQFSTTELHVSFCNPGTAKLKARSLTPAVKKSLSRPLL